MNKTKEQLVKELEVWRWVAELEKSEAKRNRAEEELITPDRLGLSICQRIITEHGSRIYG